MALVDETYFKYPIDIDYSKLETVEKLTYHSDFCEDFWLKKLMGNIEYYKYVADKALTEGHDARYTNLLSANAFTYQGITYKNDVKQMIAYFMYFDYVQESAGYNSVMGEQSSMVENSERKSPGGKLVRAWNSGVELYNIAYMYLLENIALFPDLKTEKVDTINIYRI
jgi:hypothetical protein